MQFENRQTFRQIWRFVVVGVVNTFLDFLILNILSKVTGIGLRDRPIIFINAIAFSAATTNSYFMNKYWSFGDKTRGMSRQFTAFLLISLIGAFINSGVLSLSDHFFDGILAGMADLIRQVFPLVAWGRIDLKLNIAKAFATAFSLIWNFVGYKFFVFKK